MKNSTLFSGVTISERTPLIVLIASTAIVLAVSIFSILQGWLTIFQNLFYFPIIIACVYYLKRGFIFSVVLAATYFGMMVAVTQDLAALEGAIIRVIIFILVAAVITYLSITRARTEDAVREREERFRLLFDGSRDALMTLAPPAWKFTSGNQAAIDMFGAKDLATFISLEPHDLSPPQQPGGCSSQEKSQQMIGTALTKGSYLFEWTHRRLNGEEFPATVLLSRFEMAGQTFLQATVRDITEQKELEQELLVHEQELVRYSTELAHDITERTRVESLLREKSEELDRYFTSSLDLLCIATTRGQFIRVNPEWENVLGFTMQELEGRVFLDLVHPDDMENTLAALSKLSNQEEILNFENRYRCKDGSYRWIEWRSKPHGEMIYSVARDITARKRAEDALRKANCQLNLLGSITRHDINNKLIVILGYLGIMKKKFSDPVLLEYLKKMESASEAIGTQITFTKVYQDLGSHEPQWQELGSVLPHSHIPATITLNTDVQGVDVYADPMLEKVFFNLLDNSIRHGERVSRIGVSVSQSDEGLTIAWEDNGIGIPAIEKERIFERGFGKNTGLGMFLVRDILLLTDITIKETGVPGKGARFEITVPKGMYRRTAPGGAGGRTA